MTEALDDAKRKYRRLMEADEKQSVIDLLVSLRTNAELSVEDTGWALWNICDNYAILRDAERQLEVQSEFHEWSKTHLYPLRLHWVVSDGTQAMTLIAGGYSYFWWRFYEFANEECPHIAENRTVRFESHRATAAAYTRFREFSRAETALNEMEKLLAEDPAWVNGRFATVTFRTLLVEFYGASGQGDRLAQTGEELERNLDDWLLQAGDAIDETPEETPLLGSWAQLNADRPPSAVFIGIHNAACAFAKAKQFHRAERFFRVLIEKRRPPTTYGESLFLLSCWENRHDREEIVDWLEAAEVLTLEDLRRFVPQLWDILTIEDDDSD